MALSLLLGVLAITTFVVMVVENRDPEFVDDALREVSEKTLYVVWGQLRGGPAAHATTLRHAVDALGADLALLIPDITPNNTSMFFQRAKYVWRFPEVEDWGEVLDEAARVSCPRVGTAWRKACDMPGLVRGMFGAAVPCTHVGSNAIILGQRWLALTHLTPEILKRYDWFVFARSDFLYECSKYPRFTREWVWVKKGEEYGGYSDRYTLVHRDLVLKALNVTVDVVCDPEKWLNRLKRSDVGPEQTIKRYWEDVGLSVKQFPLPAFTVRADGDPTRWSQGTESREFSKYGLKLKYPDERRISRNTCRT